MLLVLVIQIVMLAVLVAGVAVMWGVVRGQRRRLDRLVVELETISTECDRRWVKLGGTSGSPYHAARLAAKMVADRRNIQ